VASELAPLFQAARDWSRASDYYLIDARNAARVLANQEAIALGRGGLEMTKKLPDHTGRALRELKFLLTIGQPLMTVRGFAASETLQTYLRAHELSQQLGDERQLFRVQFGLSIVYVVRAEYDKARHFAEQCLKVAERVQTPRCWFKRIGSWLSACNTWEDLSPPGIILSIPFRYMNTSSMRLTPYSTERSSIALTWVVFCYISVIRTKLRR
jgi:hypothetical protein